MRAVTFLLCLVTAPLVAFTPNMEPDVALRKIKEGNIRYATDQAICLDSRESRRMELVNKQNPIAIIVGCSDSRVGPDLIFDQGLGDLFVVRIAGNVVGDAAIESVDYAVNHLHSGLIVVMGHANCGAVSAVLSGQTADMQTIASKIEPALQGLNRSLPDALERAIKANVAAGVIKIRNEPRLKSLIDAKQVKVVGAYYRLDNGNVEFLD